MFHAVLLAPEVAPVDIVGLDVDGDTVRDLDAQSGEQSDLAGVVRHEVDTLDPHFAQNIFDRGVFPAIVRGHL